MKFYTLDTEFTFGKYEGKTVKEVLELQPNTFGTLPFAQHTNRPFAKGKEPNLFLHRLF
jgi:hypothetical protein